MFWIPKGLNQGQVENVNLKKWNLNLATNARMFWIRGETQFLGGECETKNGVNLATDHGCFGFRARLKS